MRRRGARGTTSRRRSFITWLPTTRFRSTRTAHNKTPAPTCRQVKAGTARFPIKISVRSTSAAKAARSRPIRFIPVLVYGNSSDGNSTAVREIPATGWEQNVDPVVNYPETLWRATWTLPIAFSPIDRTTLYVARQKIFRTRNGGQTWQVVSPDLSRANEGTPANLDATRLADNNNIRRHGVVYTIAPSYSERQRRLGRYRRRLRLANARWYAHVAERHAAGADLLEQGGRHRGLALRCGDRLCERSTAIGSTTTAVYLSNRPITARPGRQLRMEFPTAPSSMPFVKIRFVADCSMPARSAAFTFRFNDGASWQPLQLNLPVTSIRDIAVHGNDLVVATHGRSFWVMDDISPLRQLTEARSAGTFLFAPSAAYRVRPTNQEGTSLPIDEPQVENAPVGLYIDYYLPDVPRTPVVVEIISSDGKIVRSWSSAHPPKPVDRNRSASWRIGYRNIPCRSPKPARTDSFGISTRSTHDGPLVPPGTYTVRLSVNGQTYTRAARVLRDPRISATDADLRAAIRTGNADRRAPRRSFGRTLEGRTTRKTAFRSRSSHCYRRDVIGEELIASPDDSVGAYSHDFSSFYYLEKRWIIWKVWSKVPTPPQPPTCAPPTQTLRDLPPDAIARINFRSNR